MCGDNPPVVIGIHDSKKNLIEGVKKDAPYIADLFRTQMEDLCPGASQKHVLTTLKKDTDCFWFDDASNVQKAGQVLTVYYPRAHVFHGSEYVLGLYFSDVDKLPPIRVRHVVECHLSSLATDVSHLTFVFYAGSNIKNFPLIHSVWLGFKSWDLRNIHCTEREGN